MGTSRIRKRTPLGPYRRPRPRVLGGRVFSYGRGTFVTRIETIKFGERFVSIFARQSFVAATQPQPLDPSSDTTDLTSPTVWHFIVLSKGTCCYTKLFVVSVFLGCKFRSRGGEIISPPSSVKKEERTIEKVAKRDKKKGPS